MATERGLAGLAFADPGEERAALADMKRALAAGQLTSRTARRTAADRQAHFRSVAMAAETSRCAWC